MDGSRLGERRILAAVGTIAVIAVGTAVWWTVLRDDDSSATPAAPSVPRGSLRVVLTPAQGTSIPLGETLEVTSDVTGADGALRPGQCVMTWRDEVRGNSVSSDTTACNATFSYPTVTQTGTHHVTARAVGKAGAAGTGSGAVDVYVSS